MALSRLVTLSISSLRNLDIEANRFYYRAHLLYDAALLTQCYTQHALQPYEDSKINHIRHFIKIQLINKGIEFINLPSIFKDKSVISSITTYFESKESPIICFKYNKLICSTVLTTRVSQKLLRVDTYLLRWLTYTNQIWHMHAMNCPASEYAKYKTMQSIDCRC